MSDLTGKMRKAEVVLLLGCGVAAGWLALLSSPATRDLESSSILIPQSAPVQEPAAPAQGSVQASVEPEVLVAMLAAWQMPAEEAQAGVEDPPREEDRQTQGRPRSAPRVDRPALADEEGTSGSANSGGTEPGTTESSPGNTTTGGGTAGSGGGTSGDSGVSSGSGGSLGGGGSGSGSSGGGSSSGSSGGYGGGGGGGGGP